MSLLSPSQRRQLERLSRLTYANPFLPERPTLEKELLGRRYLAGPGTAWSFEALPTQPSNVPLIQQLAESLASAIRRRLLDGERGDDREYELYEDLVLHLLFLRLDALWRAEGSARGAGIAATWQPFCRDLEYFLLPSELSFPSRGAEAQVFAGLHQLHRAFQQVFQNVLGRSTASVRLRAAIWQSIFTHDMRRYRRSLYQHLPRIATLIAGPSGTGKELVARAIGCSQYRPFELQKKRFAGDGDADFIPLHLAALPATLVESELFGHARGSFTGAIQDRVGWLERAGPGSAVFLDEVGEIEGAVQVKLLRVLQTREFSRVGEHTPRRFSGKLMAATNRDLLREIELGRFRQDLYFRLCGDLIQTPSLQEQLADAPEDLALFVRFIARQVAPDDVDSLTADVLQWIERQAPRDYAWPGNFRELEQCVRNVLVHNQYAFSPRDREPLRGALAGTESDLERLGLTADQLLSRYCTYAYWRTGSFERAAAALKLDRRTVRAKIDADLLRHLTG